MQIIIQSWGDIITNSSSETFCISNGSIEDLQKFIDTILKVHGLSNSLVTVKEEIDYQNLPEDIIKRLSKLAQDYFDINQDSFFKLLANHEYKELEELCIKANTTLLKIANIFNSTESYGMIFTHYTIETNLPNTNDLKHQVKHLSNLFDFGEYEY